MEFYRDEAMGADTEMTEIEIGTEQQYDPGDYPDGFDPSLYDL
ncbi:hypothetical protein [Flagellimonas iocasae]|uniref:Uncharacterized protein n=1 Tax=Flagellimonas iocasae TaxID=2055905 RepID=A0ABW4Y4N3_9FLAO